MLTCVEKRPPDTLPAGVPIAHASPRAAHGGDGDRRRPHRRRDRDRRQLDPPEGKKQSLQDISFLLMQR